MNSGKGGQDIVKYDASSGKKTVLVSSDRLIPEGGTKPLSIADYRWSEDNTKLLLFTNTQRVWRYNTRGDYWLLNLVSGKLQQLGKEVERSTMMFAKFSPDASKVAYVSKLAKQSSSLLTEAGI
jgi:dipeptidyl-peptidase-4